MRILQKWFFKWLLLSLLWFVLNSIDFSQLQLNDMSQSAMIGRTIMSLLDSLILCWVLARSSKFGLSLAFLIFLAVFGMKIVLTVVEATYLPDLRPIVSALLINGFISSWLWVLTAVALTVGFTEKTEIFDLQEKPVWTQRWFQWILKPLLLAIIWMVLFVIFGGIVFMNIAKLINPVALSSYANLEMPAWVLPFQGLRAILWLLLTVPLLSQLYGKYNHLLFLTASMFAVWMGSNLFLALELPAGLRYAHLVEVSTSCFVFGVLVFIILARRRQHAKIKSN